MKKKTTLIVVEDDEGLSFLIKKSLEKNVDKIIQFYSGKDLFNQINKYSNPLLLLDYKLADMTGHEIISKLKKKKLLVPFIIMSGHGDENIAVEMMKLGAKDYLVKDVNFIKLLPQVVDHVVKQMHIENKLQEAKANLKKSEEKYRHLFENSMDGIIIHDLKGTIVDINKKIAGFLGYNRKEILNINIKDLIFSTGSDKINVYFDEINKDYCCRLDVEFKKKSGEIFNAEVSANLYTFRRKNYVQSIVRDITARKKAEEEIKKSLKEKEVLLKEIHHRVKNNMQIISSLLSLQANKVDDVNYKELLKISQNRIYTLSLIHEMLYEANNLASINFSEYIARFTDDLISSYKVETQSIGLDIDAEEINIDIDFAIPISLIINELLTNAIKYAFPKGQEGKIKISFYKRNGKNILIVKDNGIGISDKVEINNVKSLGLKLVNELTRQINGKINIDRKSGSKFEIIFK